MVPRVRGRRDRDYRHVIHHYSPSFNPCSFLHVHLIFKVESLGGDGSGKSSESVSYRSSGRRRRSRRRRRRRQAQRDVEGRESREWIERVESERERERVNKSYRARALRERQLHATSTESLYRGFCLLYHARKLRCSFRMRFLPLLVGWRRSTFPRLCPTAVKGFRDLEKWYRAIFHAKSGHFLE